MTLVVDTTSVYWASFQGAPDCTDATVMQVPIAGGTPIPVAAGKVSGIGSNAGFAVDTGNVYWGAADGTLMKVPLAGATPETLATGAPYAIVADATGVYFTQSVPTAPWSS